MQVQTEMGKARRSRVKTQEAPAVMVQMNVRVPPELLASLRRQADEFGTDVSGWLRILLSAIRGADPAEVVSVLRKLKRAA